MTPSNSSVHPFARRSSSNPYPAARNGSILRRIFERAPEAHSTPSSDSRNGTARQSPRAAVDPVSSLLQETVLNLWRDERVKRNEPLTDRRDGAVLDHGRPEELVALQTITCKKEHNVEGTGGFLPVLPHWKRILDVTLIVLSAPLWLPLMGLLMLAVRLSSRGPIFYRQERVGHHGRRFMIYKFRSMKVDAATDVHEAYLEHLIKESVPMVKLDGAGDPRIVPWGRLMRATGLDELPQIFNVLRGEMSLVGPRPCTVHEFSRYSKWQQERVKAAPGLTGYWQVNGKNKTTFNEMIQMDIFYAKNVSFGLDLSILLKTIPALVEQTSESFGRRRAQKNSFPLRTQTSAKV
jgi:lipopolysaccharide/colanic/teichoic acid biosynthesis glycosyltransferase